MLRYKTKTRPGLVALYDIRPGNGAGPFLQPRSPHGAVIWWWWLMMAYIIHIYWCRDTQISVMTGAVIYLSTSSTHYMPQIQKHFAACVHEFCKVTKLVFFVTLPLQLLRVNQKNDRIVFATALKVVHKFPRNLAGSFIGYNVLNTSPDLCTHATLLWETKLLQNSVISRNCQQTLEISDLKKQLPAW